jgi:hypothetical protein
MRGQVSFGLPWSLRAARMIASRSNRYGRSVPGLDIHRGSPGPVRSTHAVIVWPVEGESNKNLLESGSTGGKRHFGLPVHPLEQPFNQRSGRRGPAGRLSRFLSTPGHPFAGSAIDGPP